MSTEQPDESEEQHEFQYNLLFGGVLKEIPKPQ